MTSPSPAVFLLGQWIRHMRTERSMTLEVLGRAVSLAPSQLSMIENGLREPKFSVLTRIAAALGTDVATLTQDEPPTDRARLELELAHYQSAPMLERLGLPRIESRRSLPDDALAGIVALHAALDARVRESAATQVAGRQAMTALRLEGQAIDNYHEDIEDRAADLMASIDRPAGPLTHHTVARLAEHLGYRLVHVDDLPASTRTITDRENGVIYLPPATTPGGHGLRSLALQALAHRVLQHREPADYAEFLRQRIEITTFAAACLVPRDTAVPFLLDAKAEHDIALEDLRDAYGVTHETAAHRFTSLATRFLDLPVHFVRIRRSGAVVKAYENDGIVFPSDAEGGIVGQIVCAKWAARTAFASRNRSREHYQYTDTPTGTYWCSVQTGTDDDEFSITLGTPFAHAKWFRGRETTVRRASDCPDPACCRRPDPALEQRWHASAWPSAKLGEHVLAPLPTGRFPGVDDGEVYRFLESHAAAD
ncbi:helix-turn-helix transcriptional regulator [Curtobacterium sp. ISL-83]|uniref:helix-turn-helix transcriptional regulator n=1 Tax=Curtobacterium sp. ISL-83 TaxID=2819145 RepID=UPI001BE5BDA0|nr:helix-turn-helix transcriptional regulator [Curtobacterium sp. ISL-83]MBT2501035.1 helix-turn-helix domain-containing protein [Curtobacterium sp. ISL-83]